MAYYVHWRSVHCSGCAVAVWAVDSIVTIVAIVPIETVDNNLFLIAFYFSSSATISGPRTLSLVVSPFLISIFTPSLKPVVTCLRS